MAKVIKAFSGVLDGEIQPRHWKVGDEVPAGTNLEYVAIQQGWCKKKPPRNKAQGAAPLNKSASSRADRPARKKTRRRSKKSAKKS